MSHNPDGVPDIGIPALMRGISDIQPVPPLAEASLSEAQNRHDEAQRRYPIISSDPAILALRHELMVVADSSTTVLISGESGTGKELFARHLHLAGRQHMTGKYVALNCAAIPGELADSYLFGHVRGAFTGADRSRTGFFREAQNGTLLLDDVTTLPLRVQAKLLRTLQEQEIVPVGSDKPHSVSVRLVAATSKDIYRLVESGDFLEDLYYRLNQYPLPVPPLRARLGDIGDLVQHFCSRQPGLEQYEGAAADSIDLMMNAQWPGGRAWPGNVRQLESVVTRACVLAQIARRAVPALQDFKLALDREAGIHQTERSFPIIAPSTPRSALLSSNAKLDPRSLRTSLGQRSVPPKVENYLGIEGTLLETVFKFSDIQWGHWKGRLLAAAELKSDSLSDFDQAELLGIGVKELTRMKRTARGEIRETAVHRGLQAGYRELMQPSAPDLLVLLPNLPDLNLSMWRGRLVAAAVYQSREGIWQGRDRCELLGIHKTLGTRYFQAIKRGPKNQSEKQLVLGFDQIDQELLAMQHRGTPTA